MPPKLCEGHSVVGLYLSCQRPKPNFGMFLLAVYITS